MSSLPTWTGRWVPFRLPVEVRVACNSAILAAPSLPGPAKLTKLLYKTQGNLRKSLRFLSLFPAGNGLALETTRNSNAGGSQGSEQGRWLRIQIRAVSTGLGCPRRSPDTSNHKQPCSQRPASASAVRDNPAFEPQPSRPQSFRGFTSPCHDRSLPFCVVVRWSTRWAASADCELPRQRFSPFQLANKVNGAAHSAADVGPVRERPAGWNGTVLLRETLSRGVGASACETVREFDLKAFLQVRPELRG